MKWIKSFIVIVISGLFVKAPAQTQNPDDTLTYVRSLDALHTILTDSLTRADSLWYRGFYNPDGSHYVWEPVDTLAVDGDSLQIPVTINDDTLRKQIERLNATSPVEIVYHPGLVSVIKFYLTKRKKYLEKIYGQAEHYYFPLFESYLDKNNLPLEIKFLPIIESALNPRAESRMGARGLWQFMYFTGKRYGLEITSYLDERMSPERSTQAACDHLNELYGLFKDWNLVLAAYNSGPGNVSKAIRRSGGYRNYWNLRPFLPRETAGYVPQFQAVWFLYAYKDYYGIKPRKIPYDFILTDTIRVRQSVSFDQLHRLFGIPVAELEFLNPAYRLNIVPYVPEKSYILRLPYELAQRFKAYEPQIYAAVQADWDKKEKPLPKFYKLPTYIVYRVRPGDYLGRIARRYHTSVRKIMRWNHLRSTRLRVGQKLRIYTRQPGYASQTKSPKKQLKPARGGTFIYHTVRKGDSLWQISRKYRVSVQDLQRWNGIKGTKLKPGTRLKIYKS